jgi:hypothetical protein
MTPTWLPHRLETLKRDNLYEQLINYKVLSPDKILSGETQRYLIKDQNKESLLTISKKFELGWPLCL